MYQYVFVVKRITVYPKKYAHVFCFAVLCCGYTLTDFLMSIRLTSLALWQSNDCLSASKATLMNMDKYFMWIHYERSRNHNKAKHNKTCAYFLGYTVSIKQFWLWLNGHRINTPPKLCYSHSTLNVRGLSYSGLIQNHGCWCTGCPYPEPVVFQWQSSGNLVCLELRPQCTLECHWRNASASSGLPVAFQWSSSVFQLCKLTLDRHWDTTGCKHQPVWFQWHPSVLVAPVVFQCVPIMQINTGSPLEHHWVLASASVIPVASQCTCGSSGLPVRSVQWYPSVLTESGLEVIGSGHFPACDP